MSNDCTYNNFIQCMCVMVKAYTSQMGINVPLTCTACVEFHDSSLRSVSCMCIVTCVKALNINSWNK